MHFYNYKSIKELLSIIKNVDVVRILDVTNEDEIEDFLPNYSIEEKNNKYYTISSKISNDIICEILDNLEKSNIEEIELLEADVKKFYINFVERVIQIY